MSLMDPCDALLHTLRATESWMFSVIWSVPYSVSSVGYLAAPREVSCLADPSRSARNDKALVRWLVGFSITSSACGLYMEIAVREREPNSTQGACGSRSSPPRLLSAVSRSFHRACTVTCSPHREEVGLPD